MFKCFHKSWQNRAGLWQVMWDIPQQYLANCLMDKYKGSIVFLHSRFRALRLSGYWVSTQHPHPPPPQPGPGQQKTKIKRPFDESLAAEWKRHVFVYVCVYGNEYIRNHRSWAHRTQTCMQATYYTGRNDTTKYVMTGRIRDEEAGRRGLGEERTGGHMLSGWTSREGREGGTNGNSHTHTKKRTHKCTYKPLYHLQSSLPCQSSNPAKAHIHVLIFSLLSTFMTLPLSVSASCLL